jgi:hypothetical protein
MSIQSKLREWTRAKAARASMAPLYGLVATPPPDGAEPLCAVYEPHAGAALASLNTPLDLRGSGVV